METRKIGSLNVSIVGLGTNNFGARLDQVQTSAVLDASIEAGATFIDTADMYGGTKSEEFIGNALKGRRDEVVIATKFGIEIDDARRGGAHPDYVRSAAEGSLRRLQTDYIDLLMVHRPDPKTPIQETLGALAELVTTGKVVEIGCSTFTVEQLREAEAAAASGGPRFVNLQSEYSILHREVEDGVLDECVRAGIGFVPYRPFAGGFLTGKYRRNEDPPSGTRMATVSAERRASTMSEQNFDTIEALRAFCEERDHSLLDLAMSWLLAQRAVVSVISGASTPEQVRANVNAASWKLDESDLLAIDKILSTR